ncbi:MAG TPA: thiamine pyrophosphate-dependent dehydrogenase E1 component subunit alpha [Clostridia bacterium]|nr:thiamine pyrophosphate-dependent dehydrogenase E1 component subunit alpha [Clostridia bacterium]
MLLSRDQLLNMYRKMVEARRFEEKVVELFYAAKIPGFLHSAIGQEAIAAGIGAALEPQDRITIHHRGHGHCIAKGLDMKKMMAELFAKKTGYCGGKGGSMHLADFDSGMLGANGIVGGSIPHAVGVALADKMRGTGAVTVCCFGDGASNQGAFHEALNLASIWKVPVVFFCENNLYGMTVPQSYHQAIRNISDRAVGYGMPGVTIDGNDVLEVYVTVRRALDRARKGDGPTLIEAKTYRHRGHWEGDPDATEELYRPREEIEMWKARDPVVTFERELKERGYISEEEVKAIDEEARRKIEEAIAFAEDSPEPDISEALTDIYTD